MRKKPLHSFLSRFSRERWLIALAALAFASPTSAQEELYRYRAGEEPRWISPENPTGAKGAGGSENRGAKGHAFETIPVGATHVLADIRGAGTIDRMWMTIEDRSPEALRELKLEMFWDGAATPAVSAPLGDFFLHGAGEMVPMETALLASPEGRSFVSYLPMPFRKAPGSSSPTNRASRSTSFSTTSIIERCADSPATRSIFTPGGAGSGRPHSAATSRYCPACAVAAGSSAQASPS